LGEYPEDRSSCSLNTKVVEVIVAMSFHRVFRGSAWSLTIGIGMLAGNIEAQVSEKKPAKLEDKTSQPASTAKSPTVLSTIDGAAILEQKGRTITVKGKIVEAAQGKNGIIYLNFTDDRKGLVAICPTRFSGNFKGIDVAKAYKGKDVLITGFVEIYRDRPQVVVYEPANIKVVEQKAATVNKAAKAIDTVKKPAQPEPATKDSK